MSAAEWRGGFPVVFQGSVATTAIITDSRGATIASAEQPIILGAHQVQAKEDGRKGPITCKYMVIVNHDSVDANILRVYFSQGHFDDDVHFIEIPGGGTQLSTWRGPVEAKEIFVRAVAGTPAFEITAFVRRG